MQIENWDNLTGVMQFDEGFLEPRFESPADFALIRVLYNTSFIDEVSISVTEIRAANVLPDGYRIKYETKLVESIRDEKPLKIVAIFPYKNGQCIYQFCIHTNIHQIIGNVMIKIIMGENFAKDDHVGNVNDTKNGSINCLEWDINLSFIKH